MRIGHGYDAHRFASERKLILGGVDVPHTRGLLGHSDADVLTHALMDALLGAAALGDIGQHFPAADMQYKDADSIELLKKVNALLRSNGYMLANADCTIVAQEPKLAMYLKAMRVVLAAALDADIGSVNVKATTEEGMGFTGRGEGIAAHAVVLVNHNIKD